MTNNSMLKHLEQAASIEHFRWQPINLETVLKNNKQHSLMEFPVGSAAVILIEQDGMLLAVSRKNDHQDLGLPGGKIEPGESPISAACREAVEELDRPICNPILVDVANIKGISVFIYRADLIGNIDKKYVNKEGALVTWAAPSRICTGSFGKFNKKFVLPLLS